ncbi:MULTISPECIES: hypothetical protein [Serratia]|jgi:hypothetical protein|uniref:Uncharacterized protein n=1 Tax=Serratia fonticola TaxID=47917 RepID=A0AAW3WW01_SERFO|nr:MULTISPECIES: hypothetical protein [Serratia]ALX97443.1 hypothetical protein AV650_28205 [Serratia fonticola]MBC3214597.1 hypothetical protein [Serratia fonticola]NYA15202.1 hypothetical protein [Serratia fonticola]NYA35338.1 hypothetical protein [Serratia fonticola]OCJ33703.1 hypothetical protein A6U95_26315 [Serratia sp. 14-2641]
MTNKMKMMFEDQTRDGGKLLYQIKHTRRRFFRWTFYLYVLYAAAMYGCYLMTKQYPGGVWDSFYVVIGFCGPVGAYVVGKRALRKDM